MKKAIVSDEQLIACMYDAEMASIASTECKSDVPERCIGRWRKKGLGEQWPVFVVLRPRANS
jgi:hypothetical protein